MGYLTITDQATPSTPSAGSGSFYPDTNDNGRLKQIRPDGQVYPLSAEFDKNILINGGFDFWQRQVPGTLTSRSSTTARVIGPDRWGMTTGNATTFQCARVDTSGAPETGLLARYYARFNQITANAKVVISQVVEGHATMPLRGRKVRFQTKIKRVGSAYTARLGLVQLSSAGTIDTLPATFVSAIGGAGTDPTFGTNLTLVTPDAGSGIGGTVVGNAISYAPTTGWTNVAGVWTVPASCKNIVPVIFTDGVLTAGDEIQLSETGLYDGPAILDWVPIPIQLEFDRCRRFYEKSFTVDQNPTTNVGVNTGELRGLAGKLGAVANAGFIWHNYAIEKRAPPTTLTVYNPAAANALARNITGAADMGASAITGSNAKSFYVNATGVAATAVGDLIAIHYSADSEL